MVRFTPAEIKAAQARLDASKKAADKYFKGTTIEEYNVDQETGKETKVSTKIIGASGSGSSSQQSETTGGMSSITGESVLVTPSGQVVGSAQIPQVAVPGLSVTSQRGSGSSSQQSQNIQEQQQLAINLAGRNKQEGYREGAYTSTGKFYPTTSSTFIPKGFEQGYGQSMTSGGIGIVPFDKFYGTTSKERESSQSLLPEYREEITPTEQRFQQSLIPEVRYDSNLYANPLVGYPQTSLQQKGTVNQQPATQFYQSYTPYELTPTEIGKGILIAQEKFAKKTGQTFKEIAEFAGMPTYKIPLGTPSQEFGYGLLAPMSTEQGEFYTDVSGKVKIPTKISLGPEQIGKVPETFVRYAPYVIPIVGEGLMGASALKGIDTYKTTIVPTKQEILNQYKPTDITRSEYEDYLKTPEGKQFSTQVDEYISGLKAQKTGGLLEAGLSAGLLFGTGALKVIKYEKQPIKLIDEFQPLPKPQTKFIGIVQPQEEGALAKIKTTTLMPDILGIEAPRYKVQLGRYVTGEVKGKPSIFKKGYETNFLTDVIIPGEGKEVIAFAQPGTKVSTYQTLTKPSTYKGTEEVLLYEDISKLPKTEKYVVNKLLEKPIVVTEETLYYGGRGQVEKGQRVMQDPLTGREIRFMGRTKSSTDFLVPSRTEVYSGEVIPAGRITPSTKINEIQFFNVETAAKKTTSQLSRASGKVDLAFGEIAVLPKKAPIGVTDTEFIIPSGKRSEQGLLQSLSMKEQAKLVAQTSKAVSSLTPKVKTPRSYKPMAVTPQEEFLFYPTYVGGLGKGISQYARRGRADTTLTEPLNLKAPSQKSEGIIAPQIDFQTLSYQPTTIKQRDTELFGVTNKEVNLLKTGQIEETRTRQRERQMSGVLDIQKPITIERSAERTQEALRQPSALRTAQRFAQPQLSISRLFNPLRFGRPKIPEVPYKRTPFIPLPLMYNEPRNRAKISRESGAIFYPYVKRYGKFFALGGESTPERALAKGKQFILGGLGASVRVKSEGGFLALSPGGQFRSGKRSVTTLVQLKRQRISSFGEKQEILRSRRGGIRII